ncbi:HPt (histidine-containing phosphotransfer) domain-containing protein [Chitinivorax tropicus]|uniref:HPt (Histidine-containing phosphotransfer) domain-containing protein n=1 Tax=Chitinivorax tropicus TaxID=714531 RepID=A0A840MLV4_9PROT|nr:HD domain-containing phosphohydrolase [Chitinivorax tropicus]MBB5017887.1 HPt (histidine-containing phosphotransfer) domain-containing protein [Chitinivorax tropicus]
MIDQNLKAQLAELNPEALQDYRDAFEETQHEIERHVNLLLRNPNDNSHIHTLFRGLHTLKSNAAMCQLQFLVDFAHPLEDVMGSVRACALNFTPALAEVLLLGVDRLKQAADAAAANRALDGLDLVKIANGLRTLARTPPQQADELAARLIHLLSGHEVTPPTDTSNAPPTPAHVSAISILANEADHPAKADLQYFRQLSVLTDRRSPFWDSRTSRLLPLALDTNAAAGHPVDPVQLEGALYMHDVGMVFLSENIWAKQGKLTDMELREMRTHPVIGSEMLKRMAGWQAAAQMVLEHHERIDGTGYPNGLKGEQISPGAQLLAIVDAFEAMTHERGDRYHKRSIIRAITEINACDGQFGREWIPAFNQVVRRLLDIGE